MRHLVFCLVAGLLGGCSTQRRSSSEWPAPFPFYVSNRTDASAWVVWTLAAEEQRSEVAPGEDWKILPPFVTDSVQPKKEIVAIESSSARFDLSLIDQSRFPKLRFVIEDPFTLSVWARLEPRSSVSDEPLMRLKGAEPNQALQPTPMLVTPRADARVAPSTGVADL